MVRVREFVMQFQRVVLRLGEPVTQGLGHCHLTQGSDIPEGRCWVT